MGSRTAAPASAARFAFFKYGLQSAFEASCSVSVKRPMRREKRRAQTLAEIKQLALSQLAEFGASGLNLRAIARDLEMSSAGIYRYYASRDDLLVALIADGFESLGAAIQRSIDETDGSDAEQLHAAVDAYRSWSKTSPQLFALLFTDPVPGFAAPSDGPTDLAVRNALAPLSRLAASLIDPGSDAQPAGARLDVAPHVLMEMMSFWAAVHGLVSLEVFHHLDWADIDLDEAFTRHVTRAIEALGALQPR